ncbi:Exonuclease SbcC [Streptomyces misionensis JCM 4497]
MAGRGGTRLLRRGVRADRDDRRAQPLPQHGPRLGGPRRLRRRAAHPAVPVPRRRPGRHHVMAGPRHQGVPGHAARPGVLPRPGRLRPLDPAGTPRRDQPVARGVARRTAPLTPRAAAPPRRRTGLRRHPA